MLGSSLELSAVLFPVRQSDLCDAGTKPSGHIPEGARLVLCMGLESYLGPSVQMISGSCWGACLLLLLPGLCEYWNPGWSRHKFQDPSPLWRSWVGLRWHSLLRLSLSLCRVVLWCYDRFSCTGFFLSGISSAIFSTIPPVCCSLTGGLLMSLSCLFYHIPWCHLQKA